jgi:two-component system, NtrC family, response regulator AtoC
MKAGRSGRGAQGAPASAKDAETVTLGQRQDGPGSPTALYVTGPEGGTRHLLPPGELARIGRGADCTVTVDDPRASRSHAALRPAPPYAVTDLGSANGTFVGRERLTPGKARTIAAGETFFVGDSSLVMRPSGLAALAPERVLTLDRLAEHVSAGPPDQAAGTVLMRVRTDRSGDERWLPMILGELLVGPRDWLLHPSVGPGIVVGLRASSRSDAASIEREILSRLGGWAITATAAATFVPGDAPANVIEGVMALVRGSADLSLRRGAIIIRDPAMETLRAMIVRVAKVPLNALVLGETGVGKDIVASMLHELSARADRPFVRLNCASLPENLIENELFGHERGAFSGADRARPGLIEAAQGGTMLLDEIGDLPLSLQVKLLNVIESREVARLGGVQARRIDVRFVAATNRPLERDVQEGRFRLDLFHRLSGVILTVPPLRERQSDIEPLARNFLEDACARFGLPRAALSAPAVEALQAYHWPGNVRELRNVVERAALLAEATTLTAHHLGLPPVDPSWRASRASEAAEKTDQNADASSPITAAPAAPSEREAIEQALLRCGGNQSRAADLLGMPRRTLVRRIAQLGLPRPREAARAAIAGDVGKKE